MATKGEQLSAYRERIRVFLAAVQAGASDSSAAAEAGISRATVHRWLHGERPFDEAMRKQVQRARAIRERRWISIIERAADDRTVSTGRGSRFVEGDWKAAQFLLSVTNPEFAMRNRTEVSGPGGAPMQMNQQVEHVLSTPDPDRLMKVVELLNRAGALQLTTGEKNGNGNGSDGNGHS